MADDRHADLWGFESEQPPPEDLPIARKRAEQAWAAVESKYHNPEGRVRSIGRGSAWETKLTVHTPPSGRDCPASL